MKKITKCIAPVAYFPPIHYFAAWLIADEFLFEAYENYQKGSFRNRCLVVTSQGVTTLSIPLSQGKNEQQSIREVKISNPKEWQKRHWSTLQTAYGSAPFWEHYAPKIEKLIKSETTSFFDLAQKTCFLCADILHPDFRKKAKNTTAFMYKKVASNVSETISDKASHVSTDTFFFEPFMKSKWLSSLEVPQYAQLFDDRNGFTPFASILDLLLCHGNRSLGILYKYADTLVF